MKPIIQTKFGRPDGNCLEACVASIMEVGIDEVPDFPCGASWFGKLEEWAALRGFECIYVPVHWPIQPVGYYIMNGPGRRGLRHSVVAHDGIMVHDPHPSGAGLLSVDSYVLLFRPCGVRIVEEEP